MALETHFGHVQIFRDELAFAKYREKEWPSEQADRVVAGIVRNRLKNRRASGAYRLMIPVHWLTCDAALAGPVDRPFW